MITAAGIIDAVNQIKYKNWIILIGGLAGNDRPYLKVQFTDACGVTGKMEEQHGRKWFLSYHMTKSEVIQTAFKACLAAEEHECREKFKYRGQAIFGPHFNVDVLVALCGAGDHQEKRKEKARDILELHRMGALSDKDVLDTICTSPHNLHPVFMEAP